MNIKRIFFWACFAAVLGLIVWGMVVAMNKPATGVTSGIGEPREVSSADHILGPADAKVTLLEYGDFQCPACSVYAEVVERLMAEASTTLRVVFRHYPLPQHQHAMLAAQVSEAAALQGKFWEMYRLIYAGQRAWEDLEPAGARKVFEGYADSLGLDKEQLAADIASPAVAERIEADRAESQAIRISYTPTFFVNGEAIENPQSYEAFKTIIEAAAR